MYYSGLFSLTFIFCNSQVFRVSYTQLLYTCMNLFGKTGKFNEAVPTSRDHLLLIHHVCCVYNILLRIHAVCVCDDASHFHEAIDAILDKLGLSVVRSRDIVDIIEGHEGRGYGLSTDEELGIIE